MSWGASYCTFSEILPYMLRRAWRNLVDEKAGQPQASVIEPDVGTLQLLPRDFDGSHDFVA